MKRVKNILISVWNYCKGKKTYGIGICAIIYGLYTGDEKAVGFGLGFLGIRHGITTEISRLKK